MKSHSSGQRAVLSRGNCQSDMRSITVRVHSACSELSLTRCDSDSLENVLDFGDFARLDWIPKD